MSQKNFFYFLFFDKLQCPKRIGCASKYKFTCVKFNSSYINHGCQLINPITDRFLFSFLSLQHASYLLRLWPIIY